ncbi:MAG: dUTP diphosphatase [Calditrichia bacterium]
MKVRIYRKDKSVALPKCQTPGSAGLDVHASATTELWPGEVVVIPTGLIIEPPRGFFYKIHIRSSVAIKNGICLANDVGIIDEDYCGPEDELKIAMVRLYNPRDAKKDEPFIIEKGTRIAQIIFEKNYASQVEWQEMNSADFAGPTRGGIGSTGK